MKCSEMIIAKVSTAHNSIFFFSKKKKEREKALRVYQQLVQTEPELGTVNLHPWLLD